jgi:hypothetical protein
VSKTKQQPKNHVNILDNFLQKRFLFLQILTAKDENWDEKEVFESDEQYSYKKKPSYNRDDNDNDNSYDGKQSDQDDDDDNSYDTKPSYNDDDDDYESSENRSPRKVSILLYYDHPQKIFLSVKHQMTWVI